jgi:hypothetical protein
MSVKLDVENMVSHFLLAFLHSISMRKEDKGGKMGETIEKGDGDGRGKREGDGGRRRGGHAETFFYFGFCSERELYRNCLPGPRRNAV